MEDQLVAVLANTQSPDQGPRQQAELELKHALTNPAFPISLANVASHASIDTAVRQAALTNLRLFSETNWSPEDKDEAGQQVAVPEETRELLRRTLLDLVLSTEDNRKVKIAAR